jgi:hypothetical protein
VVVPQLIDPGFSLRSLGFNPRFYHVIFVVDEGDEMGRACSTNGGRRRMHVGYWWESQKERDHLEDQDVGVWTIVK